VAVEEPHRPDSGATSNQDSEFITYDEYEMLPIGYRFSLSDGYRDVENRYPFVVMVAAAVDPPKVVMCSGILLTPRLVLTAGHCVCGKRKPTLQEKGASSVIDASRCARTATIDTAVYTSAREKLTSPTEQFRSYDGTVRPHPNLEILLDEQLMPLSSRADFAMIALDKPVEVRVPTIRLPDSEPQLNEPFVIVGYGLDGRTDLIEGFRRSGWKEIASLPTPGSERFLFEPYGAAFTTGSGEPTLEFQGSGFALTGITTLSSVEENGFTSTYVYRDWLRSEIRHASSPSGGLPKTKD